MQAKICGVKNAETLNFIIKHKHPPKFIGFICNYPKSKRYLDFESLKKLINKRRRKKIKFVSVLVNPTEITLKKIKKLNFDYLQLYDVSPEKTKFIKKKYKTKIITALTIKNLKDVLKYKNFVNISEIILFDSKGYEKSLGFNHQLLKNVTCSINKMLAGNIKYNDNLDKYDKITDIIDISGSLETQGEKDNLKIDKFLKNIKILNDKAKKKSSINRSA